MITAEEIYARTNKGRDIIEKYYPQSSKCFDNPNLKFKIRDEKTPSAAVKMFKGLWWVTDFGSSDKGMNGIDVIMKEDNLDFAHACSKAAAIFGIGQIAADVNKPEWSEEPLKVGEKPGTVEYIIKDGFSDSELRIMGPRVKQEHIDQLHWQSVKAIRYIKDNCVKVLHTTDKYPIFRRHCLVKAAVGSEPEVSFFKVYTPYAPEKKDRFKYFPYGSKPPSYINGLEELKAEYRRVNDERERNLRAADPEGDSQYKEMKLEAAVICSGERDAICVRSFGFWPLWFNSETHDMEKREYDEILKFVQVLYNIPDLDATGKTRGTALALEYPKLLTIWLPRALQGMKDNRGRAMKDFRDWCETHRTRADFNKLLQLALPSEFWIESWSDKKKRKTYEIDSTCLNYFLSLHGFCALHDEDITDTQFVRIQGNIVRRVRGKDIRSFINAWAEEQALDRELRNLFLKSPLLSDAALDSLKEEDIDFCSYTSNTQLFFFPNGTIEVGKSGIKEHKGKNTDLNRYVWEENVIKHNFKLKDSPFKISRLERNNFDIEVLNTNSKVFGYLINASRMFWRKEIEEGFKNDAERDEYMKFNRFRIDGQGLTDYEVREQKQHLINKIFAIGYLCHRFKSPSRAWAPQCMDNKIGDDEQCNGRSGKSFLFTFLKHFMKVVALSGRNPKLMENEHAFELVTKHTDLVLLDDCAKTLHIGAFYDSITSDLTVNPKHNHMYTIPFNISPKMAFTTNFVPTDFSPSTEARMIYLIYSDYYHQASEDNDYIDTVSIRDDFGKDLFGTFYSEDEWNEDINFLVWCTQFYLSVCDEGIKIQPPMSNIIKRKLKQDMGANFEEWANSRFADFEDNTFLNCLIKKDYLFDDCRNQTNLKNMTVNNFRKRLDAFCTLSEYIDCLNPEEQCDKTGKRIVRKDKDTGETKEFYFIQTVEYRKRLEKKKWAEQAQQRLDF